MQAQRQPAWGGSLLGLVSMSVGLGLGELVAGLIDSWASPVVSVGDRVIDGAPPWLKDFAIDTLGTNDKPALLTGTVILLGLASMLLGVLATRGRLGLALIGVAGFALIGWAAGSFARSDSDLWSGTPSLIAGVAAAGTMVLLIRLLNPTENDTAKVPSLHGQPLPPTAATTPPQSASTESARIASRANASASRTADGSSASPTASVEVTAPASRPHDVEPDAPDQVAPAEGADQLLEEPRVVRDGYIPAPSTPGFTEAQTRARARASRRRFLYGATAAGAVALVAGASGRWLRQRASVAKERASVVLGRPASVLPNSPTDPATDIAGLSPLHTPNKDFYRIDTALTVPNVSTDDWTLRIHGMVDSDITLTYDQLLKRELFEFDHMLSCVSNQVGGDLAGSARWLGVRLDDLLEEAGIDPNADQIMGRSVDGFTAGFPTAVLDGRDSIIAVGMNGEPLPISHGYPARLVIPGLYGYVSATKWLKEIELTTFEDQQGYWIPRGWAAEAPIKIQSRIDTPKQSIDASTVAIAGVAWAPLAGVGMVEVQIDDGSWREATVGPELSGTTWRQWWIDWDAQPGTYLLRCRATDNDGNLQTADVAPPRPDGATGYHEIQVSVS